MEEIGILDFQPQQESGANTRTQVVTGTGENDEDKDLYVKFKKLQRQLEFLQV